MKKWINNWKWHILIVLFYGLLCAFMYQHLNKKIAKAFLIYMGAFLIFFFSSALLVAISKLLGNLMQFLRKNSPSTENTETDLTAGTKFPQTGAIPADATSATELQKSDAAPASATSATELQKLATTRDIAVAKWGIICH